MNFFFLNSIDFVIAFGKSYYVLFIVSIIINFQKKINKNIERNMGQKIAQKISDRSDCYSHDFGKSNLK